MKRQTSCWIASLILLTGCSGSFCDLYEPVYTDRAAGAALIAADRPAAEAIAQNNGLYESECR